MGERKAGHLKAAPKGKEARLAAIHARYRWTMGDVYNHPRDTWTDRIREAVTTFVREKAAVGAPDGDAEE